jgi:Copper type II ascorbate-dependent monooxygenase, C-terminal domain
MQIRLVPGLLLVLAAACAAPPEPTVDDPTPNWYRDVEPIVSARCAGCHSAGAIGPFAFDSYASAVEHAAPMADAVKNRRMPPWMPSGDCQSYLGDRRLAQEEIDAIVGWAEGGTPLGDPKFSLQQALNTGESLAWVDKTIGPDAAYTPSTARVDDYRCFQLDPQLTGARDLIGFEVEPGVRSQVHHVLLYSVTSAEAQALDDAAPGAGWPCFGGPGTDAPKMVGGWVPGTGAVRFPGQTGVTVYGGDVLIMQVHYNLAGGAPAPDRTLVNLQYSRNPVPYHAQMLPLVQKRFTIMPNELGATAEVEFQSPVDATVWGVVPHMHTRGKSVKVEMKPPSTVSAPNTCLVDIPKWDFQWQQFYFFKNRTGLPVEQDWSFKLTCTWDNPTDKTVKWGEGTDDEMCLAFVYVTGRVD